MTNPMDEIYRLRMNARPRDVTVRGWSMLTVMAMQTEAIAALIAPPGRESDAVAITRRLLAARGIHYTPPSTTPTPEQP